VSVPRWLPAALLVAAAIGMLAHGPIPQTPNYHDFADQRALLGVPNSLDVLSNVPFLVVGLWGLWAMRAPELGAARAGYTLFAWGLILTSIGSGFYHLAPDNFRLVFDRIPIALAAAGLIAGTRAATVARSQSPWFTVGLGIAAIASVLWWYATDLRGRGDLGPYLYIQFAPLVVVPLWQAIGEDSTRNRLAFAAAIVLYGAAKVAEVEDKAIFASLGIMSGHTIKHLLAAAAAVSLVSMALPGNIRSHGPARV